MQIIEIQVFEEYRQMIFDLEKNHLEEQDCLLETLLSGGYDKNYYKNY